MAGERIVRLNAKKMAKNDLASFDIQPGDVLCGQQKGACE
jgi:hypothetical protein